MSIKFKQIKTRVLIMAEEKKIVFIGNKPLKRVNRFGRDYLFLKGEPTAVPEQVAYNLLQIPSIFALPEQASSVIEKMAEEQEIKERSKKMAEEQAEKAAKANTWKVRIDGEVLNISKYPKGQLEAVIVAESLPIDPAAIKTPEGVPPAEALRMAVRDALHEKHGNPELEAE
ncbi:MULTISPECIES: hypothetical protein [Vibrio harveyi group]|uniref:hypothetical protein n=1 Tax=Vibrio harveyi group TaxID=717610 RepID=UPI0011104F54|nr:hypothetical protein [Vibrio parahaemolyticus]MDG2761620.1 hypothetical protein [Vibrio parahaemolyticus]